MVKITKDTALVRKPLDFATGKEISKCKFAFWPGTQLPASEPEIVVKAYDSLHFQNPDTAMFMIETDADDEAICKEWEAMGKPKLIVACMKAYQRLKNNLPEIPIISFYEKMLDMGISGGCNSVDYIILDPDEAADEEKTKAAVRELADGMGVKMQEDGEYPYIVYSITQRDEIKNSGKDAVHILELIYGMGASNTHMIHEHDHDRDEHGTAEVTHNHSVPLASPDCDGNCASCSAICSEKASPPAPLPTEEEKLQNLQELKQIMLALYWNEM